MVAAVGDRQHAQRDRDAGAAARSARGLALVVGVERAAEHVVVGVGAEPEFRRVGLADDDGAGALHALDHDGVGGRHEILEDARALRGADALGRGQVLDRLREAVHPAADIRRAQARSSRALACAQQIAAVLQRDDGVDLGIERVDVVEVGVHHLDAGHLLGLDRARQRERVHHHDVGGLGHRDRYFAAASAAKPRSRSAIRSLDVFEPDVEADARAARRPFVAVR